MKNKTVTGGVSTKDWDLSEFVAISSKDAEEYRAYKKLQKIAEITGAISRSGTPMGDRDNASRVLQQAARFHQAAVKITPAQFLRLKSEIGKSSVKVDCTIGGNGETISKVKAYEAKLARKMGAKELTLVIAPSLIFASRYSEIKKELKRVKRAAKRACLKIWVDKNYPFPTIARLARICSDAGAQYFCVPYFAGCERLRYDLFKGCRLEVSEVETLSDFKKMTGAGVGRIVTSHISEIYFEWMKEVENVALATDKKPEERIVLEEKEPETEPKQPQTASDLKFV